VCQQPFSVVVNLIGHQKIFAAEKRLAPNYAMVATIFPVFFGVKANLLSTGLVDYESFYY
jgi:hypothetical protein